MSVYIETDCAITFEGKRFEQGGAVVTPDFIVAYPGPDGVLLNWHGKAIGHWRITATWRTPRSWFSSTMHQIEARVNGVLYTGRGAGEGMIYKGKAVKQ